MTGKNNPNLRFAVSIPDKVDIFAETKVMTCRIHFYHLNDHFSLEYALEHNNGEPSEMNRMYLWEDEFAISIGATKIDSREYSTYTLQGTSGENQAFAEEIKEMRLFYIMNLDQPVAVVGCSEILLDSYEIHEEDGELVLTVRMKGEEPLANPVTGIYIASKDFPKSLIVNDRT